MRYENEKCALCNKTFSEGDDIVVCPECGAPHHRQCYESMSRCAFENLHSEDFVWHASQEERAGHTENKNAFDETKKIICPVCGTQNDENAQFCTNCRAPLVFRKYEQTPETIYIDGEYVRADETVEHGGTVTVGEASVYIRTNKDSFLRSFLKAKFTKSRQKFNWAAFFFTPYWFFYRKMYSAGSIFAGISIALTMFFSSLMRQCFPELLSYLNSGSAQNAADMSEVYKNYIKYIQSGMNEHPAMYKIICIFPFLFLLVNILAGFCANRLYLSKISKDIQRIRAISVDKNMFYSYLFAKGGTSILMAVMSFFAIRSLTQLLMMF